MKQFCLLIAFFSFFAPLQAIATEVEDLIKYRQGLMNSSSISVKALFNYSRDKLPLSMESVQQHADIIYQNAKLLNKDLSMIFPEASVIEGKTEAEVMDLLDHSQNGSVKHYFRYTHEMNEILNEATNKRVEQQHFVAAWTREGDQTGNIYGEEIVEKKYFTSVGKCQKGSPCAFEPAVACYQCDKFCPNKDADAHKKALETLDERRQEVLDTSTGAVVHQFDSAIAGCKAAIAYSEGERIQVLEVKSDSEVMDDE